MVTTSLHPDLAQLQAFAIGTLDGHLWDTVEAHLEGCVACQQHVAGAAADSFVAKLIRAHVHSPTSACGAAGNGGLSATESFPLVSDASRLQDREDTSGADDGGQTENIPESLENHPRYRIVRLSGMGGMGSVYEAEHRLMQRRVALKVINSRFFAAPDVAARFRREVRAAAKLSHPNIVTAYDAEQAKGNYFLVMEYVEGVTIGQLVKKHGPLPVAEACDYARQAALGLQHAHEQGLVHRDIKPDNLIRDLSGVVKVLDFGLATLRNKCCDALQDTSGFMDTTASQMDGNEQLTRINDVMGTLDFMAPEQAANAHAADIRADVYSLGCTLYYMLTGQVPYPQPGRLLKARAHQDQPVPSVCQARPDVPQALSAVVERMLAKLSDERFQTPGEAAAALEPFVTSVSRTEAAARDTTHDADQPRRALPRRRILVAALTAVSLLGIAELAAEVYRIETDKGELIITSDSDDVEVVVKQGGRVVRVMDTKTDRSITLRSGVYDLELAGPSNGLKIDIEKATFTRGETVLARIERVAKPSPSAKVRSSQSPDDSPAAHSNEPSESSVPKVLLETSQWSLAELPKEAGFMRRISLLSFDSKMLELVSRDGRLIALQVDTGPLLAACVRVIETSTGHLIREVGHDNQRVTSCIFLPDGKQFLACFLDPASMQFIFRLWNLETGKETAFDQIENPGGWPCNLCLSDDAKRLSMILTSADNCCEEVRIFDLESGSVLLKFPCAHAREGNAAITRLSPDGKLAMTATLWNLHPQGHWQNAQLRIDDLEGKTPPRQFELPPRYAWDPFYNHQTAEFGTMCFREGKGLQVEYWNATSGASVRRIPLGAKNAGYYALASSGTRAAVKDSENPDSDNRIHVYDLPTGTDVFQTKPFASHERISLSDDGRLLAVRQSGEVWLYRLPDTLATNR